jgi:PAS domain S-box-containing protein
MTEPRGEGTAFRPAERGESARRVNAEAPPRGVTVAVRIAGAIAITIGAFFFIAWLTGAAAAWSASGVITMKTNMALAQVLAGTALLLLSAPKLGQPQRAVAVVFSAVVLGIGALTLAEHVLRVNLGIDQLLATEQPGAAATASPNRMGPPGSTSLVLLGAGFLALGWRRRRVAAALALAACLIVLVPAVGFLYGIGPFYSRAGVTDIAWPTVIALFALGVGLALAGGGGSDRAVLWRDDPGGVLLRTLLPGVILVPLVLGYLRVQGERRGMYGTAEGTGLFGLTLIFLFSVLLWRSAVQLSASAAARQRVADALRDREERLTQSVQQLSAEKERLGVTLRSIGDAVIATDDAGRIDVFNAVAEELTGWKADEAVGRPLDEVFHIINEQTRQPAVNPVERVLREGVVVGLANHTVLVARDGSERPIADSGAPIRGTATGMITGVVLVFRDQTEERRAAQALLEADRRKREFLGVLSHELRNPLAPIRNGVYVLSRSPPGSDQANRARDVIQRQTEHLARLVDDLLDVTRIERGKIELQRTRLDLGEVVRRTCDDYRSTFQARRMELRVEAAGPAWIDGDETRIAQIVGNLLQNAAKFSDDGATVTVRVDAVGGAGEIRVRDAGAGMSEELLARLFEPFAQADAGLARSKGGLGLGLALVKGLAELHGGSVQASSEGPGLGSEFVIRLPLATNQRPSAARGMERGDGAALDVLIIEDNVDAAESLADVLRGEGHRVYVAIDGRSGVALARERKPDVVLCDIGLPDVDGYEVARTLRGDPLLRSVRLIAVTGYAQPEDKARAEAAGFDGHLAKPAPPAALVALLNGGP